MAVREMRPGDEPAVLVMMQALWPDAGDDDEFQDVRIFVWERDTGELGGVVVFALRPWADGCVSRPCPDIEGWWVAPDLRRTGAALGNGLHACVASMDGQSTSASRALPLRI